ncbi:MAG TPA: hypothetical protein VE981_09055 [Planctomycetota bacterium]|nr:hypothetical protein [Planctomycetota bacterium]
MDFEKRYSDLKREHQSANPFDHAYAFLDFHLEWAEAIKATDPEGAIRQYGLAEDCQSTIGTGATSGGEGLASMTALYEIMGKRADVIEGIADAAADPAAALKRLKEALAIWTEIEEDPNGLAELQPSASRLRRVQKKIAARTR